MFVLFYLIQAFLSPSWCNSLNHLKLFYDLVCPARFLHCSILSHFLQLNTSNELRSIKCVPSVMHRTFSCALFLSNKYPSSQQKLLIHWQAHIYCWVLFYNPSCPLPWNLIPWCPPQMQPQPLLLLPTDVIYYPISLTLNQVFYWCSARTTNNYFCLPYHTSFIISQTMLISIFFYRHRSLFLCEDKRIPHLYAIHLTHFSFCKSIFSPISFRLILRQK